MEDIVRQMMSQGIQSPEGIIQCMGNPGQRMPVGDIEFEESRFKKTQVEGAYKEIIVNVLVIIHVQKFATE